MECVFILNDSPQSGPGWEAGGNIEHRAPNIEHRSEEKRKIRLNQDLLVEAIEGAVEEICRDRTVLGLSDGGVQEHRGRFKSR